MSMDMGDRKNGVDEISEINVTPFIDVILVLLIIFMVAAPLSTVDMPVDLPASSAAQKQRPEKPVFLTIKADLKLAIGEDEIDRPALASALQRATNGDPSQRIFVRADKSVAYGELMIVMELVHSAGFGKVALVALEAGR